MNENFWKSLKSGTDIRGVAVEVEGGKPVNLTNEVVYRIARGFAHLVEKKAGKEFSNLTIAVGRDSRISGERILNIVCDCLSGMGVTVLDCELASTPAMFMTTVDLKCDASIQITASHHPFDRNGLKFFLPSGGVESEDITEILEYAQKDDCIFSASKGEVKKVNYMAQYCKNIRNMICREINAQDYEHPLKGFKIAVDAGNGVGGFYATDILAPLGADTTGSRFLEPDGMFPNHAPNPENPEAMRFICEAVTENNADLGLIFDTDVDRCGAVDSSGNEINRNSLIALASEIALENNKGGTIVTDSITSDGLKIFIEDELGGKHHRFKRGYRNVIREAMRLNGEGINCPLAIETSGHAAMRENYFLDDGAYLCTKIIIKAVLLRKDGKTLEDVLKKLSHPAEAVEKRLKITTEDFRTYGNEVIKNLEEYAINNGWSVTPNNYEGIRASFDKENGDGWFLLRLSVHDPIMPLNVESNTEGGTDIIIKKLIPFLQSCKELDITTL